MQSFLRLNRKALSKQGFSYPAAHRSQSNGNATPAALSLSDETPDWVTKLGQNSTTSTFMFEFFWSQLLDVNDHAKSTIIASSEEFEAVDPKVFAERSQFDGKKKKIVVFLRRQDRIIESLYVQLIRYGFTSDSISKFVQNAMRSGSYPQRTYAYYDLLEKWAGVFGKENVMPVLYRRTSSDFLYRSFLKASGISMNDSFVIPKNLNQTKSNFITLNYFRIINKLGLYTTRGDKRRGKTIRMVDKLNSKFGLKNRRELFSLSQRKQIMDAFLEQNQKVSQEYFDSAPSDLFDTDDLRDIKTY